MSNRLGMIFVCGVLAAVTSTLLSALLLVLYIAVAGGAPLTSGSLLVLPKVALGVSLLTAPSAVAFGFIAGCIVAIFVTARMHTAVSMRRTAIECGILGGLLSMTFPQFHHALHYLGLAMWRSGRISNTTLRWLVSWPTLLTGTREIVFAIAVGVPCALLVGTVSGHWKRHIQRPTTQLL